MGMYVGRRIFNVLHLYGFRSILIDEWYSSRRVVGLTMTINVQQYEYVTQAGDTAGIVVGILPQYQMPFPEDDGTLVSPGHATSIGIVQVCTGNLYR